MTLPRQIPRADAQGPIIFQRASTQLGARDFFELAAVFYEAVGASAAGSAKIDVLQCMPGDQNDDRTALVPHREMYTYARMRQGHESLLV
jgi:hypothetical protein